MAYCVYNLEGENGLMLPYGVTPVVMVIHFYREHHLARDYLRKWSWGRALSGSLQSAIFFPTLLSN